MIELAHIWQYWASGGLLLVPLAVVSFGIVLLVAQTQLATRALLRQGRQVQSWLGHLTGPQSPARLLQHFPRNDFAAVFAVALGQVHATGASPLAILVRHEEAALQCVRKDLVLLAALTAAAPLLGLLGTVGGMIATFDAVAEVSGQTGTRVAGGISQALITTQFGLIVAMPGVVGLAHLRQATRDVQFLLGDCHAHLVALLGGGRGVAPAGGKA